MAKDLLTIEHHELGTETFGIESARFSLHERDDGVWEFLVHVRTSAVVQRAPGLDGDRQPYLEAAALLDAEPALRAGTVIVQEQGYDDKTDQNLSSFYYFEYESVEELRIEVFEVTNTGIDALVTGVTIVNGSKGRAPDARLSLRARFTEAPRLRRSFQ